ncbi:MAG: OadG family protein [Tannerella sp.]|jgi:oxaloacetate decarboxylase gamma subunit|nr:OadG family protein [Tannerella sp.]
MDNLDEVLVLMAVGMTTVFLILLIVIGLGKLLILIVNRYIPEAVGVSSPSPLVSQKPSDIPSQVVAAIVAAVSIATDGKGKVKSIKSNTDK